MNGRHESARGKRSRGCGRADRAGLEPSRVLYLVNPPRTAATREYRPINALSALLAFVIGVIHAGLAPVLSAGDMRPNLILACVVAVTALAGLEVGVAWAFVGGLTVNLLTTDPLGGV